QRSLALVKEHASKFYHQLNEARILSNMAVVIGRDGRWSEAEDIYKKVLKIGKESVKKMPELFKPLQAAALSNLSITLGELGKVLKARTTAENAINQFRELHDQSPMLFGPHLISALNNQGILLKRLNKLEDAEIILREAWTIGETLDSKNHHSVRYPLRRVLENLANLSLILKKTKEVDVVKERLSEFGVRTIPSSDSWLELELEEDIMIT
ncbi:MAG: tetratricopeptide repeat protein, partial [Candidatus Hodarchaeota archaeon]